MSNSLFRFLNKISESGVKRATHTPQPPPEITTRIFMVNQCRYPDYVLLRSVNAVNILQVLQNDLFSTNAVSPETYC